MVNLLLLIVLYFMALPVIIEIDYRLFYKHFEADLRKSLARGETDIQYAKTQFLLASILEIFCFTVGVLAGLVVK